MLDINSLKNNLKGIIFSLAKKNTTLFGLDIGTSSIKAVEIKRSWSSKKEAQLSFSVVDISQAKDDAAVIAAIKQSVQNLGLTSGWVNFSFSGPDIITRYILLPKMQEKDLISSLEFELMKHIPHKLEDMVIDYQIIDRSLDGQMLILVVGAERKLIEAKVGLIKQAGLEPKSVNVDSFAIIEAFQRVSHSLAVNDTSVALLDIGHRASKLAVLEDNNLRFSREIAVGSQDLTKLISERMNIDLEQAAKLKCSQEERPQELTAIIDSNLNSILDEIRLSLDYCQRLIQKQISSLYLSGGGARLKDIDIKLKSTLEMEVNFWNPVMDFKLSPGASKEESEAKSSLLAAAIGLALS